MKTHRSPSASLCHTLAGFGGVALSMAVMPTAQAGVVTWSQEVTNANTAAALIAPVPSTGKVLFVPVQPSDPTPQERAAQAALAQAERTHAETVAKIAELRAEQNSQTEATRAFAELQAQLAQVRAEKEALAVAQNQATQAAASTEARLREETQKTLSQSLTNATQQTNTQLAALKETTSLKLEKLDKTHQLQAKMAQMALENIASSTVARLSEIEKITQANRTMAETQYRIESEKTAQKLSQIEQTNQLRTQMAQMALENIASSTVARLGEIEKLTQANRAMAETQYRTESEKTAQKLTQIEQTNQLRAQMAQMALENIASSTVARLSEIEKLTQANREMADLQAAKVAQELKNYATEQLASYASLVSGTLQEMALQQHLKAATLEQQTATQLQMLYASATTAAANLAEQKAATVSAAVAKLQNETEAKRLTVAQVEGIAANTVAEATPKFQELAIDTLRNAKSYIRSIARNAVTEADPVMQQALENAASKVITADGKVAFTIRKAVLTELNNVTQGAISGTQAAIPASTRLGDDAAAIAPAAGPTSGPYAADSAALADPATPTKVEEVALDATRLRLARLLAPKTPATTPADNPTQAATLAMPFPNAEASVQRAKNRTGLVDIRQYRVVIHEDQQTLPDVLSSVLTRAEPFAGPWQIKWKISEENKDILNEKFSLDAETTFEDFVSYLAQYLLNDRGVKLTFSLFDRERVMLVSD